MSLTLEQVRQTRFHLARRNGYEPVDVDDFVDKVESTLSALNEENSSLRQQVESLKSSGAEGVFVPATGGDEQLRSELNARTEELSNTRRQLDESAAEVERLRAELTRSGEELEARNQELADSRATLSSLGGDAEAQAGEMASLREQLAAATSELEASKAAAAAMAAAAESQPKSKVENIVVSAAADAAPAVTKLLQMATEQAERLVADAETEAERVVAEAQVDAAKVTADAEASAAATLEDADRKSYERLTDARTRAERIESEARVNAEKVTTDAQTAADSLNAVTTQRRAELFSVLEEERRQFEDKVKHLRSFEAAMRQNLTSQLQHHLDALAGAELEPQHKPDLLTDTGSNTPRLDALLNKG